MKVGIFVGIRAGGVYIRAKQEEKLPNFEIFDNWKDFNKYDIVEIHWHYPLIMPLLMKLKGKKFIQVYHGNVSFLSENPLRWLKLLYHKIRHKISLNLADKVITVSKFCNSLMKNKADVIIHNGVDTDLFKLDKKTKRIFRMGDWGDYTHKQVAIEMGKSKYFIKQSNFDTFGLDIAEAMSCGCIVLINNLPVFKELFENVVFINENGMERENLSQKARKEIINKYSEKEMLKKHKEFYEKFEEELK